MAWALVMPASRGIGLALTRQLLLTTGPSLPIVATARSDPEGTKARILDGLFPAGDDEASSASSRRLDVQRVDLDSESSIADTAAYCQDRYNNNNNNKARDKGAHLRLGLLVPGMLVPERAPEKVEYGSALATLKLNLLAPMMLMKYFSPFLPRKTTSMEAVEGLNKMAIMALMSARVGSISDNRGGGWFSYRASKAGVNQLVRTLDIWLRDRTAGKAMAVGLHPGTVRTDLSKEFWASTPQEKLFEPAFSAERLVGVLSSLDEGGRGKCWDWKHEEIAP